MHLNTNSTIDISDGHIISPVYHIKGVRYSMCVKASQETSHLIVEPPSEVKHRARHLR